ncbi:MAG: hypothetical protein M5U26_29300 [Planctomycetota bacterium]|nr:hypothetical protein [Planctomycetota bacterium]
MCSRSNPASRLAAALLGLALALCAGQARVRADLEVNTRKDLVTLKDGTEIECIVLMESPRAVMVVVKNPDDPEGKPIQKVIPAEQVAKIERGKWEGTVQGFQTTQEQTQKVVQGSGYRKVEKKEKDDGPVVPVGRIGKVDADTTLLPGPTTPQPKLISNTKLDPRQVSDAYLTKYPALVEISELMLGSSKQAEGLFKKAMDGDPEVRKQLESYLNLFLTEPAQAPAVTPGAPAPGKPAGPQKVPAKPEPARAEK